MIKQIFHKDILLFILANIFADVAIQNVRFGFISILPPVQDFITSWVEVELLEMIFVLSIFSRFVILPVTFDYLEKNSKNLILQKFIFNLKNSNKTKLFVLFIIICYIFLFIIFLDLSGPKNSSVELDFFGYIFISIIGIFISLFFGSLGNYIALYIYWYLDKKFSKLKKFFKFIFNKYTVIIAILSYILITTLAIEFRIFLYIAKFVKIFIR